MEAYKNKPNVDNDAWKALVASTVRTKVWAYKTLAEIYGQAVWFDDAITEVTEIKRRQVPAAAVCPSSSTSAYHLWTTASTA